MSAATVLQGVSVMVDLVSAAARLMQQAQQINGLLVKAQTEGRANLTDEEWAQIMAVDGIARQALVDAIARTP